MEIIPPSPPNTRTIDSAHYGPLLAIFNQLGNDDCRRFVTQFQQTASLDRKAMSSRLYRNPQPLLDSLRQSLETTLPNEIVRNHLAIGAVSTESVDWELVNRWLNTVLEQFDDINQTEIIFRASKSHTEALTPFVDKLALQLKQLRLQFFTPETATSFVAANDPRQWGITFETRLALCAYARYMDGWAEPSVHGIRSSGQGCITLIFQSFGDWATIFQDDRPPIAETESRDLSQQVRFGVPVELLPDYRYIGDAKLSQEKGRRLRHRYSRQPDPKK